VVEQAYSVDRAGSTRETDNQSLGEGHWLTLAAENLRKKGS
jgi:hypothetical protein